MIICASALPTTATALRRSFVEVPGCTRRIHTQATQATVRIDAGPAQCAAPKVQQFRALAATWQQQQVPRSVKLTLPAHA